MDKPNYADLTVIICSYKANKEFKLCLHQLGKFGITNVLIYENSPEDYTLNRKMMDAHRIPYINNPGGDHAHTMNRAFEECKTKYALLLDSDCIITADLSRYYSYVKEHKISLYGDIQGDRGGLRIHKRVHPWFCFVDMEIVRLLGTQFVDFERIKSSHSETFVDCSRLSERRDPNGWYYDAGSSLFEDISKHYNAVIADIGDHKPYWHKEGSSWRPDDPIYKQLAEYQAKQFDAIYASLYSSDDYLDKFKKEA